MNGAKKFQNRKMLIALKGVFGPAHLVCKMTTSMCAMYRVRTVTGFLMDKVRVPEAPSSCYVAITAKIDGSTVNFPRYVSNYMTLVMKFLDAWSS